MTIAPQDWHSYRRARIPSSLGVPPTSTGPHWCRSRRPWPCSPSVPPEGRLGASQAGHWPGRASSTVGRRFIQRLTSSAACTIRSLLRSPASTGPGHDGGRARTRFPSLISRPAARRCPLLAALDTTTWRDRQSPTYAVAVAAVTGHCPSRCSREIRLQDVIHGERQQLENDRNHPSVFDVENGERALPVRF